MKQTEHYGLNQWELADRIRMEDFNGDNEKVDAALKGQAEALAAETAAREAADATINAAVAKCGNCFVQCGSYQGTGTYDSYKTLSFSHRPALVVIRDNNDTGLFGQLVLVQGATIANGYGDGSGNTVNVTWSGNSVSWYNQRDAGAQYNKSGTTYYYTALLMVE